MNAIVVIDLARVVVPAHHAIDITADRRVADTADVVEAIVERTEATEDTIMRSELNYSIRSFMFLIFRNDKKVFI